MGYAIGTSGADFRSRTNLISEKVKEQVRSKIVAYGTTLVRELVASTPIRTGQAKANWQASIGQPSGRMIGPSGYTSSIKALARDLPQRVDYSGYNSETYATISRFQIGQVLYIYNDLPYIERLNAGYSAQAPAGFVETAVMRASAAVRK